MTDQTLSAKNIFKSYREKKVLKGLNLTLEPNRIYGLVGRNGAGKTTLLSVLSAQAAATGGSVCLGEETVWENQRALDHICFSREIAGSSTLIQGMRGKEYLRIASVYYPGWDEAYARRMAEAFGLDIRQRISRLSKGMTSMLSIIAALASKADYTFLDEPTAGLDLVARDRFYKLLLKEYAETGRTFVLSTHIIEEASDIFEEVIFLKDGDILLKEDTQKLLGRCFLVSGREDQVEQCSRGLAACRREQYGRSVSQIVMLEAGQTLPEQFDVDITPVSLSQVFLALCGEEEAV